MILLRSALFAVVQAAATVVFSLLTLASFPFPPLARYRVTSTWARFMVWVAWHLLGIRYRVEGAENLPDRPSVIIARHESAWETMAFQAIFPPQSYVLKRELLYIPFFGWGLALSSPIAIDRSSITESLRQIARQGAHRLAQGFWIVIFPEGTRLRPGVRREFQAGGAFLAVKTGAPVVPVAHNAADCWPRNAFLKRPGTITVRIGAPIDPAGQKPAALNARVQEWIEAEMAKLRPGSGPEPEAQRSSA